MKKVLFLILLFFVNSCAEMQQVLQQMPNNGNVDIANGLKQALDFGVQKQVFKLTQPNGFFQNNLVRIGFPSELQQVEQGLRKVGLNSLADEGIRALNRAAENAVKEATPIFVNAIKQMTFEDARAILMGDQRAATQYLEKTTQTALYNQFYPVVQQSFQKVGADQIWQNLIQNYNSLPLVTKVNPDLTDHVTKQALQGVYEMIALEEIAIRNDLSARTTDVLKRVFAMQDKK